LPAFLFWKRVRGSIGDHPDDQEKHRPGNGITGEKEDQEHKWPFPFERSSWGAAAAKKSRSDATELFMAGLSSPLPELRPVCGDIPQRPAGEEPTICIPQPHRVSVKEESWNQCGSLQESFPSYHLVSPKNVLSLRQSIGSASDLRKRKKKASNSDAFL
jgi:hypothetical protein